MSNPLATYSFIPWLRQGIANGITQADGDVDVRLRASIAINVKIEATKIDGSAITDLPPVERTIQLYGPGDIIGIDSKAIIKTEPRNWITNFEPNYLPYIDFYEEDFPWRYTPSSPENDRLKPWLTLVVLKEDEFEDGTNIKEKPLPFFNLKEGSNTADIFPNKDELWAWAHVHVNSDLSDDSDEPGKADRVQVTDRISHIIQNTPDLAYSRIISPRKLEANVGYYAFLIPTFESGRLAGLGKNGELLKDVIATKCSWDDSSIIEFPYYYRWYFRTGLVGDFEYLVNLLEPKSVDKSVGVRDMDVLHPGSNLPPIDDTMLNGILKLGGALKVPFDTLSEEDKLEVEQQENWNKGPIPHPFTKAMSSRINLADDYATNSINQDNNSPKTIAEKNLEAGISLADNVGDPDPVITVPLYGRWHALQQRLLQDKNQGELPNQNNWIHELNLDPRFRVAAGLGTQVVQKNQEEYMQASWEQVGKIIEANHKIRLSQMAKETSNSIYFQKIIPQELERSFVFTSPVHRRVVHGQFTVHQHVANSVVPSALTSGVFRSIIKPRGALMKRFVFDNEVKPTNLIQRVNEGKVIIAPPKKDPEGAIQLTDIVKFIIPNYIPSFLAELLKKYEWFKFLPLGVLLLFVLIVLLFFPTFFGTPLFYTISSILIALFVLLFRLKRQINRVTSLIEDQQNPDSVDNYPKSPDFEISEVGNGFQPTFGDSDSEEGSRFKEALKDVFVLVSTQFPGPNRVPLDIQGLTSRILEQTNPGLTIPKRTFNIIKLPTHVKNNMVETFAPVMVHPEIDLPMYKPLADISSELFLPNLNKIEQNSITLLENNQKFIESYMVGINHEMSRELLWREYPTDQRGTYFRQFWDVNSFLPSQPPPEDIKEQLRDIPPIHKWSKSDRSRLIPSDINSIKKNELGSHNQRALTSGKTQLVLVIRGELLKKYPTAVVYAQKADWGKKDGVEDINEERELVVLSETEQQNPPDTKLKTPLFEAKIDPDIYFFGFDLDSEEAIGTKVPQSTDDDPGWFFVLKERPGEPRFGLDIDKSDEIVSWKDLSWIDVGTENGKCIEIGGTAIELVQNNGPFSDDDDQQAKWGVGTDSAQLAYILYQVPVMVAIHARRMLDEK